VSIANLDYLLSRALGNEPQIDTLDLEEKSVLKFILISCKVDFEKP